MTEIFLRKIQDSAEIQKIVKKYPNTPAFSFIQKELLELQWKKAHNLARGELELFIFRLDIIRRALSWYMYCTISYSNAWFQLFLPWILFFLCSIASMYLCWNSKLEPNERRSVPHDISFFPTWLDETPSSRHSDKWWKHMEGSPGGCSLTLWEVLLLMTASAKLNFTFWYLVLL